MSNKPIDTLSSQSGDIVSLDKNGFLIDLNDWSEEIASALALREGIELTDAHWEVIHLIRGFYNEFQLSPPMRPLVKYTKLHLGPAKGQSIYLTRLFPPNPAKIASKIAGLPIPDGCL